MKSAETPRWSTDPSFAGERRGLSPTAASGDGAGGVQPARDRESLKNETIATVAAARQERAQISLRHLAEGLVVLPKSIREETIRENLAFRLFDGEEMHLLDGMENSVGPTRNPDEAPF